MFPYRRTAILAAFAALVAIGAAQPDSFHFVLLGDRTGEPVAGVYEDIWKNLPAGNPAFVVSVGDTIQGTTDSVAEGQWLEIESTLKPWSRIPVYLAPGNHDIWSPASERLYTRYSGHPVHYSFDYGKAHFTVLDNSRSDALPAAEIAFLEHDLQEHATQPLKFIIMHRPSWILNVMIDDPGFELQRVAKKYGVRYIVAGHIHELLHADLDGVTYISMPSAGGHLRGQGRYEDGWFFGYATVDVKGTEANVAIHELGEPYGRGRTTLLKEWGKAGLIK